MNPSKQVGYGLREDEIRSIQAVFNQHPNITKVVIYGSRAIGNHRAASDIDLTLYGDKIDYAELTAIENELDDLLLPYTIDLSIYHQIENPKLIEHINRVGQEFYRPRAIQG